MDYDCLVIGAGPGGYVCAIRAAQLGLRTAVVEERKAGGVCTNVGCIPSKTLLHAAAILHDIKHAGDYGITVAEPSVDPKKLRAKKNRVIQRLVKGIEFLLQKNKVDWIPGRAVLQSPHGVEVTNSDGKTRSIEAKHIVIATGARSAELPHLKPDGKSVITYVEALEVESVPASMCVIGGGAIGLEMAEVYAALGTKITIVELLPTLIPGWDSDLTAAAAKQMKSLGCDVMTGHKVTAMESSDGGQRLTIEPASGGEGRQLEFERVLVAVGLRPNSDNLGLETVGVHTDDRGFIKVDDQLRTSLPSVLAIGDVAGGKLLAHKASREGHVAADVIGGHQTVVNYNAIPGVIYTHPEIASVGLTEEEARKQYRDVAVGKFPLGASGRAVSMGADGFTKVVVDKSTDTVVGVHIVGPTAGDLIGEAVHALEMEATAYDLAVSVHAHPTISETLMEAAADVRGEAVHIVKP